MISYATMQPTKAAYNEDLLLQLTEYAYEATLNTERHRILLCLFQSTIES